MYLFLSIVIVIIAVYSIIGWTLYFLQPSMVYRPTREVSYNPADVGLVFEKVTFASSNGCKLTGWFTPAKNAEFTVLLCHANAGNIAHRLDTIKLFNEQGLNGFVFDYQGYGTSEGKPSEQGTYDDAQAAWEYLTENMGISCDTIIVFGRSLGGPIAANLASRVKPAGMVLESTFTSYVDLGKKFYPYLPVRMFSKFSYDTRGFLRKVTCPLFIIHSRGDEVIPFEFGLGVYECANKPKEFLEIQGSHNDGFLFSGSHYRENLSGWINSLEIRSTVNAPALRKIS